MNADQDLVYDLMSMQDALNRIRVLEQTVEMLKRQIADETAQRYAAYQRITELQEDLQKAITDR